MTKLFLVIDDGSGEATVFALARDAAHAIERARPLLGYTDEDPGDLRAVCTETAKSDPTRKMLAHWDAIATDAMDRGESVQSVEDAINAMSAVVVSSLAERDRRIATARAEAALAEREACAEVAAARSRWAYDGYAQAMARSEAIAIEHAIRARTTPATLSTETLAAIAEARGLRVVEPSRIATAERERDEARAELAALRTLLHEEDVQDRYRTDHGCGAGACVIERPRGMTVGGGCRCGRKALRIALQRARAELKQERADLAALTARVEAEIAAAAEAVRSRAIAECVSAALTHTIAPGLALSEPDADPTQVALARVVHRAVSAVVDTLRALSAPQPAPSEPADVDPAAGALR